MSNKNLLDNVKKLRELTGVGFKDCKIAIEESNGDIQKSIDYLRKKGIAKASKKMDRNASEGLVSLSVNNGEVSIIEINSETDFVAKNKEFIDFCKEVSEINLISKGDLEKIKTSKMKNNNSVNENLINLISKIGEKISLKRADYFDNKNGKNYFYTHSSIEKNLGKIISIVKIDNNNDDQLGQKVAMHIAASNPLAIDEDGIKKEQELESNKSIVEVFDEFEQGEVWRVDILEDNGKLSWRFG